MREPDGTLRHRVFPVGIGRSSQRGASSPLGTYFTGPDPRDRRFYHPARREPAYHAGLPFVRLDLITGRRAGEIVRPYGIHGPVTPSLIWGTVSAGCIRMRPADLRLVYRLAARHPRMPVRFSREPDPLAPSMDDGSTAEGGCAEAALGARRLRHLSDRAQVHDRVCGGVDHWFAVELQAGALLTVALQHDGPLRVELYGIRAISVVARGRFGLRHSVPLVHNNRGDRYLRVVAPHGPRTRFLPYALRIDGR